MALPHALSNLNVREAIQDAIYRAANAFDTGDASLLESALTEDAFFDINGRTMKGLSAIKSGSFDFVSKLDTTHFITNTRIEVKDGASEAKATATALAQHYREGEGQKPDATRFLAGALYDLDMVKDPNDDGLWKIKVWKMKVVWAEGDWAVMKRD